MLKEIGIIFIATWAILASLKFLYRDKPKKTVNIAIKSKNYEPHLDFLYLLAKNITVDNGNFLEAEIETFRKIYKEKKETETDIRIVEALAIKHLNSKKCK